MITVKERYEFFKQTLFECSSEVLHLSDDLLLRYIFDELPIDIRVYLYEESLKILFDDGYIDETIFTKCIELKDYYLKVEDDLQAANINDSEDLKHIIALSDEIRALLYM